MSRTTSQTSTVSGITTNGVARSLSLKTNTKPALSNPLQPSDIKLFVTNLRLLDLDGRSDWPDITVQTFSAKNADQRQRIQAVEWALFRLFEIWDPSETSQKLQPFFPPLEPLQSRNLRIALHRSLDALKKDGVLGREAVLRKTMLDECKGEKFYEILSSFSSVVLKKVLAAKPRRDTDEAVARTLATSAVLTNEAQTSLLPLAIAHKAALTNLLQRKEEKRRKYTDFGHLLDAKAHDINRRIRKTVETPRAAKPTVPQRETDAIKKQLKDNWIGDQRWVEVMLHGEDVQGDAVFLDSAFNRVWRIVEQGGRLEDAVPEIGLLEDLQLRVDEQKTRLKRWKNFHDKMQQGSTVTDQGQKKVTASVQDFKFDDHVELQLRLKVSASEPIQQPKIRSTYEDIILEMAERLSEAASARYNQSSAMTRKRAGHAAPSPTTRQEPRFNPTHKKTASWSDNLKRTSVSKIESEDATPKKLSNFVQPAAAHPVDSEAALVGQASAPHTSMPVSPIESPAAHLPSADSQNNVSDSFSAIASPSPAPPAVPLSPSSSPPVPSSYFPSEPPILEPPSLSTEEALAAQIVSTIGDATPSPVKKLQPRMSLMERTRMSMVRTTSFEPISESPSPSLPLPEPATVQDKHAALIERTRLSMAAMSSKSRASLGPKERKPKRHSQVFPINQFDTPRARKSEFLTVQEEDLEKTPKEDLFSDDVDYERVFKSRPKIATSPVFGTPAEGTDEEDFDEGVTGVDLADVDDDDEEDGYEQDSPLRRRAYR
ncbi:hypothetical protein P171DRAFT_477696 [Karstenula rhodostoma CBS 690.94]|uniref:HAUS augmin-like complex subunit 6 N-terminal domain-containing protein n=1 Tax=Karstenula rhodostoma CBS 690.94 TaxID=1392251 RepID=A0A9P4P5I6_9PLEO|nr:hypothetical protein P171DRAFT_477696 [Karstenula rhodostoma CBS 690.94]